MIHKDSTIKIRPARYEALLVEEGNNLYWAAEARGPRKFWLIDMDKPIARTRRTLSGHILSGSVLITLARLWTPRDELMLESALGPRPVPEARPRTLDLALRLDSTDRWLICRPGQRLYTYCYRAPHWREVGEVGPGERFLVLGYYELYYGFFAEDGVYIDEVWDRTPLLNRLLPGWDAPPLS